MKLPSCNELASFWVYKKKNDQILSLGSFKSKGKDKNQENYNKRYTAQNPALSRLSSPKLNETQSQSY